VRQWLQSKQEEALPIEGASITWRRSLVSVHGEEAQPEIATQRIELAYRNAERWLLSVFSLSTESGGGESITDTLRDGSITMVREGTRVVVGDQVHGLPHFNGRVESDRRAAFVDIATMLDPLHATRHFLGHSAADIHFDGDSWTVTLAAQDTTSRVTIFGSLDESGAPEVRTIRFQPPADGVVAVSCSAYRQFDDSLLPVPTEIGMEMAGGDRHILVLESYSPLEPDATPWHLNIDALFSNVGSDRNRIAAKWTHLLDVRGEQVVEHLADADSTSVRVIPSLRDEQRRQDAHIRQTGWLLLAAQILMFAAVGARRCCGQSRRASPPHSAMLSVTTPRGSC